MITFYNNYPALKNIIFGSDLQIKSLEILFDQKAIRIHLTANLVVSIPINSYESLSKATPSELNNYQLIDNRTGIRWPDLDEDLPLKGLLQEYLEHMKEEQKEHIIGIMNKDEETGVYNF